MSITDDPIVEHEKNCSTLDLVGGFPPHTNFDIGTRMYAFNPTTKEVSMIFKLVDIGSGKTWMKLGGI